MDTGSISSSGGAGGGGKKRPASAMTAAGAGSAVSKKEATVLDAAKLEHNIWLVKVPAAVAKAVRAAEVGSRLGSLSITKTPGTDQRSESVQLAPELAGPLELPPDYSVIEGGMGTAASQQPRVYGFSRDPATGQVVVEGSVRRHLTLQPVAGSLEYKLLKKKRHLEANTKTKVLMRVDARDLKRHDDQLAARPKDIDLNAPLPKPTGAARAGSSSSASGEAVRKRAKMDPEALRRELFHLFSERPFWSLKELAARLPLQGESSIKTMLGRVAEYQSSGSGLGGAQARGKYRLKEQYRDMTQQDEEGGQQGVKEEQGNGDEDGDSMVM